MKQLSEKKIKIICVICLIVSILLSIAMIVAMTLNEGRLAGLFLCGVLFSGMSIKALSLYEQHNEKE